MRKSSLVSHFQHEHKLRHCFSIRRRRLFKKPLAPDSEPRGFLDQEPAGSVSGSAPPKVPNCLAKMLWWTGGHVADRVSPNISLDLYWAAIWTQY